MTTEDAVEFEVEGRKFQIKQFTDGEWQVDEWENEVSDWGWYCTVGEVQTIGEVKDAVQYHLEVEKSYLERE